MRRRAISSLLVLTMLLFSLLVANSYQPMAGSSGAEYGAGSLAGRDPNAVVVTTSTVTVTRTVNVTSTVAPSGPTITVHVVNQFQVWVQGALVEVFLQTQGSSPPTYNLVSSGTTINGAFYARGLSNYSTYLVNVSTQTGASSNQTVSLTTAGAILTFMIEVPIPPSLAFLDVSVTPSALGGALTLNASVVNNGNSTAYSTELTVSPPPQLSLLNTGSVIPIGNMAPGASKPVTLPMAVSTAASATGYTLRYTLNFSDFSGVSYFTFGNVSLPTPPPPSIVVQNAVLSPGVIQPGTSFTLDASVVNNSNSTAYNIQLAVAPPTGVSLLNTGSVIPIGTLAPGASKPLSLAMIVSTGAVTTGYTIALTTRYTDYLLNAFTGSGNLFVPVTGNAIHPNLVITSASFSSQEIHPGDTFAVPMSFQNIGPIPADEVLLSVNATSPLAIVGSAGDYRLGNVPGNGNISLTLTFMSPSSARLGSYPIILTITYLDSDGSIYSTHQSLVATLIGEPSLVLNSLRFKNNPLSPGLQTFLSAQLINVGGDNALNVKVEFQGGPDFLSNTTMYLGSITPNGSGNGTAFLQVPGDTKVGGYTFSAVVSYSDLSGNSYTITSPYSVTIAPYSAPAVSVTNTLLSPAVLSPGAQGTFTMYLRNDGDNPARNVTVSLDDKGQIFASSYFGLGTLGALTSGTTVVGVNVNPALKGGQYIINILVTYSDDTGARYNSSTPYEITVYGSSGLLTVTNVGIAAGVVVVAGLALFFLRRTKTPPK
jgi:hypothetical protein